VSHEVLAAARAQLAADVGRVADRLRSLSEARLAAPVPGHSSRAAAGRQLAQALADAGQGVEERASAAEPRWRDVPALSDFAVGEQVAVTGADLLRTLAEVAPDDPVWTRDGLQPAASAAAGAVRLLAEVRRVL
jgi:hypothetical protein